MKNKPKILFILFTFFLSIVLFIYGLYSVGIFHPHKIFITTLATTGPDFKVVLGQSKLNYQLSDTLENTNTNGIMTTGGTKQETELENFLSNNWRVFAYGDYFVITYKLVGAEQADGSEFFPLVEILSWQHIEWFNLWTFIIINILLLLPFLFWLISHHNNLISQ